MSDAPDDLGIPTKPARNNSGQNAPGQNAVAAPLGRAAAPVPARPPDPTRAAQEALRPAESGPRPAAPFSGGPLVGSPSAAAPGAAAPQRRRSAQADRRPRDHAVWRDKLVRQAGHRRQRRSQSAELPRGRTRRNGPLQGLGDDRRDRGAGPLRGQSDGAQAAPDPRHRTGFRNHSLRPDRGRVRRPDFRRRPGWRRRGAALDARKPGRALTRAAVRPRPAHRGPWGFAVVKGLR